MAKVLNLALKKDVFDELTNFRTNEIPIKKNDWWKKRLMDLDTGRFKYFDVASVSSGSSDKFEYVIDHIEDRGNFYVIVVVLPENDVEDDESEIEIIEEEKETIEPQQINPEVIEPKVVAQEVVENVEEEVHIKPNVTFDTIREDIVVTKEGTAKVDEYSELKQSVISLLDVFCGLDNNFVVNMPFVTSDIFSSANLSLLMSGFSRFAASAFSRSIVLALIILLFSALSASAMAVRASSFRSRVKSAML